MHFTRHPFGVKDVAIPVSQLAEPYTSVDLVKDEEEDARYFRALEQMNIRLNKPQIEAVRHHEGPMITLAGAGSGKTSVLTARNGYIISEKNVRPESIMLVTFTRKAAQEMVERIAKLPGVPEKAASKITAGTFHSIFLRILRGAGFQQEVISSDVFKHAVIKRILRELGLQQSFEPETALSLISSYKAEMIDVKDDKTCRHIDKDVREIWYQYETWKQKNKLLDFDDMLSEAYKLFTTNEEYLAALQDRFSFISVDEFQDTNKIQYKLVQMLAAKRNLFIVGDPRQTIFSFQGADNSIIMNFQRDYPEAKVVALNTNYRSSSHIVGLGNAIIRNTPEAFAGDLEAARHEETPPIYSRPETTEVEAANIVGDIRRRINNKANRYGDIAVLFRTSSASRALFDQLVLCNIPFIADVGGEVFYESKIAKPIVSYLRLSLNPSDLSSLEEILPSLYLNKERTMDFIQKRQAVNPNPFPLMHVLEFPGLSGFQIGKLAEQIELIKVLKDMSPSNAIKRIRFYYEAYMDARKDQSVTLHREATREVLDELESSIKKFLKVKDFLEFVDTIIEKHRSMKEMMQDKDADAIRLMTIHKSKGLEFPVVYVIGASEGILPHSSAIEGNDLKDVMPGKADKNKAEKLLAEERRLAYVAVTRSRHELIISSPASYRGKPAEVSRFLLEAFGQKIEERNPSMNKDVALVRKPTVFETPSVKTPKASAVQVFACTSATCNAWTRITSAKDHLASTKKCPMCGTSMKKEMKAV